MTSRAPLMRSAILHAVLLVALCAAIGIAAGEALAAPASAELRVLFAPDPSDAPAGPFLNPAISTPASLSRATGIRTTMTETHHTADALQASQTGSYDVIVAPAHVIASALRSGYTLLATSGRTRAFALLARSDVADVAQLSGRRMHLPQRDSLQTLVARRVLLDAGLRLEYMPHVRYGDTTSAGLVAMSYGMADATLADADQAQLWIAKNPAKGRVLKVTRPMPAGLSIAVRNDVCATQCPRLSAWLQSPEGSIPGIGRFQIAAHEAAAEFADVAELTDGAPSVLAAKAPPLARN